MCNRLFAGFLYLVLAMGGCNRGGDAGSPAPANHSTSGAGKGDAEAPRHPPISLPAGVNRVVAVGDLHGDITAARRVLRLAKLLGPRDTWVGGRTVLVQTGDLLDRGGTELAMIQLFDRLRREAAAAGGQVHLLLGNHEMLNFRGEFRYVTKDGWREFAPFAKDEAALAMLTRRQRALIAATPEKLQGRRIAFFPGGPVSTYFAKSPVILKLGSVVFVHGGLRARHVKYGIARLNREASEFVRGLKPLAPALKGKHAPTWVRRWSKALGRRGCKKLTGLLSSAKATVMVVGHTIQRNGITSACGGRIWRIDTAMAAHYGANPPAALEITSKTITILK